MWVTENPSINGSEECAAIGGIDPEFDSYRGLSPHERYQIQNFGIIEPGYLFENTFKDEHLPQYPYKGYVSDKPLRCDESAVFRAQYEERLIEAEERRIEQTAKDKEIELQAAKKQEVWEAGPRLRNLKVILEHWSGAVVSPINGITYTTPSAYADHMEYYDVHFSVLEEPHKRRMEQR